VALEYYVKINNTSNSIVSINYNVYTKSIDKGSITIIKPLNTYITTK